MYLLILLLIAYLAYIFYVQVLDTDEESSDSCSNDYYKYAQDTPMLGGLILKESLDDSPASMPATMTTVAKDSSTPDYSQVPASVVTEISPPVQDSTTVPLQSPPVTQIPTNASPNRYAQDNDILDYTNDRYSDVKHNFTDAQLLELQLSRTVIDEPEDIQDILMDDDMYAETLDNKLLQKNQHSQKMAEMNEAIVANVGKRSLTSDLAHVTDEVWWGAD